MATLIQRQLIPPPILAFLLLDVLSDNPLIAPHRRDEIAAGPEVLSHSAAREPAGHSVEQQLRARVCSV